MDRKLETALKMIEVLCTHIDKQHGMLKKFGAPDRDNSVAQKARELVVHIKRDAENEA